MRIVLMFLLWSQPGPAGLEQGETSVTTVERLHVDARNQVKPSGGTLKAFTKFAADYTGDTPRGTFKRLFLDTASRRFFGYRMAVQVVDGETVEVSFAPLAAETSANLIGQGFLEVSLEEGVLPSPQSVRPGDTIALEVLNDPERGWTVVDYLTPQWSQVKVEW